MRTATKPSLRWSSSTAGALANELQGTGTFQEVERHDLKEVLLEQELAELAIVRKGPDGAGKGQMRGARSIGPGTVTSCGSHVEQKQSGSSFGLLGIGSQSSEAQHPPVAGALRAALIDAADSVSRVAGAPGRPPGPLRAAGSGTSPAQPGSAPARVH